ncbi:MAG: 30S ribosomal protein S6 [Nitrospiraceae bacterium]|nr:30S ribosomal protein S6 [Nitrospiraceae bacterium]
MNYYENSVILDETLSEEGLRQAIEKIKSVMQEAGAQVIKADEWGVRKLAYELNKHKKGFYVLFLFKAPSSAIKKLEELYKVFDPVMKFMVIKLEGKQVKAVEASLQAAAAAEQTKA